MASNHYKKSNEETRTQSGKRDHHMCFPQVIVRTLRNRCHRENGDQESVSDEKKCRVPASLPSSSQYPETDGARPIPSYDSEPSQSSAVTHPPPYVNSSLEGEEPAEKTNVAALSKDAELLLLQSPEARSDSEDDSARNCVSPDQPTGYLNGAASSGPTCRICHEGDQENPLVSPCSCTGAMGFVHVSCLEQWLNEQNVDICELCGEHFQMAAQPISARRFFDYVWQSEGRLRQALLSDLVYLAMVTSAIAFSLVMLLPALGMLESNGLAWQIVVDFMSGAFYGYFLTVSFRKLRSWYHSFMRWLFENPVRRVVAVPTVTEMSAGPTERDDASAAGEPSTSG
ncbi:E3 ubiquitin-protein ligase MARCHF8-like [Dermacentor albipictus]|uniref:E3 ubiquitin-protein ligase MARCHF8-like n=1 Tax=Dermacentor albipictus TaxID=60249 RepID=UPI0038FCD06C